MGDVEPGILVSGESPLGYHSYSTGILTKCRNPGFGPWQMGSLTGAVASQRVTEALKGRLSMDGNHASECKRISLLDCENDGSSRNESWS